MDENPDRAAWVRARISRFGLTTVEDIRRSVAPDIAANAVQRWLTRRVKEGEVAAWPLSGRQRYFVHGPAAVRALGLPARHSEALGPQALQAAFGTLEFAAGRGVSKLTAAEFTADFPELAAPGLPSAAYFLEPGSAPRLGLILIDHGASVRRLAKKVRRVILRRTEFPAFLGLMQAGGFTVAVVTADERKAGQLTKALAGALPMAVEVGGEVVDLDVDAVVEVVPELLPLLVSDH